MSRPHFLAASGILSIIMLGPQGHLRAQPLHSKVEVDCGLFQKNKDGSWTLGRETTVNEGIYGLVIKPGRFRKDDANVFGYDLTRVLEQDCGIAARQQ